MTRLVKFVVLIVVVAALAGAASGPLSSLMRGSITVTAQFDNANGLYVGNPVSVLGMRVGRIASITSAGDHVGIGLSIDRSIPVPADVTAVTVSDSILTSRHVELTPVYRGGPTLADHAVLDTTHTRTPVEFDSLLAMADKLSSALAGDGRGNGPLADLMTAGAAVTAGNGPGMRTALDELSRALQLGNDNGAATRNAITRLVRNLDGLTAAAARNDQTLRQFGSGIHQLSELLAEQDFGTGTTGTQLNAIINQATVLLQRNRGALKSLTTNADVIARSMADYRNSLAEFLDVFPLVTDNAYNAIDTQVGALRATFNLNQTVLDGQMMKEVCNLMGLRQFGCATGTSADRGPDFGIRGMFGSVAGVGTK